MFYSQHSNRCSGQSHIDSTRNRIILSYDPLLGGWFVISIPEIDNPSPAVKYYIITESWTGRQHTEHAQVSLYITAHFHDTIYLGKGECSYNGTYHRARPHRTVRPKYPWYHTLTSGYMGLQQTMLFPSRMHVLQ